MAELGELGLMGITVDPAYGGAGLTPEEVAIVVEEIAAGDGSLALTVASHNGLCGGHISLFGSPEQKKKYLPSPRLESSGPGDSPSQAAARMPPVC